MLQCPTDMEREPFSGKIIAVLQERYTRRRIEWGTATEESTSELVLKHLKKDGVIKGARPAYREFLALMKSDETLNLETYPNWVVQMVMITILGLGAVEFFLTTAGIGKDQTSESTHWKVLKFDK